MGSLFVVVMTKAIEGTLLVGERGGCWMCRLLAERAVHALMAAVLLGLSGLDALRDDSQLDPPHAQARETADRFARERRPVVAADAWWQTELAKRQLEVFAHWPFARLAQRFALEQVAARSV